MIMQLLKIPFVFKLDKQIEDWSSRFGNGIW